jgi:hypothetical protein
MFKENGSDHRHSHHHSSSLSIFGEPNAKFAPFSVAYDPSSSTLSSSSWGLKLLLEVLSLNHLSFRFLLVYVLMPFVPHFNSSSFNSSCTMLHPVYFYTVYYITAPDRYSRRDAFEL